MLKKIKSNDWTIKPCYSNDHLPPSHMVYEPGTYEWTCPSCGHVTRFVVHGISMTDNRDYMINASLPNALSGGRCQCELCERGRKFAKIINKLRSKKDIEWMSDFYDYVIEHEESTSMEIEYLEYKLEKQSNSE